MSSNASRWNRRRFLQSGAALSAAAVIGRPSSRAWGFQAANDRPRFATIGLRNQGWGITSKSLPLADFVALADVDSQVLETNVERLKAAQPGKAVDSYSDYRAILERDDIDAVMIAAPDHWHTKISVEAMLAGKDVYCEKPLTLTIDEGKLIERVVEQTGRVFQVGTQQRTENESRFLLAIALIRAGRIGTVRRITCGIGRGDSSPAIPIAAVPESLDWDRWLGPVAETPYRALPTLREGYGGGVPLYSNAHYSFRGWHEYSGGQMADWGAHHVDIACWALGDEFNQPTQITPLEYELPGEYVDGFPTVHDRYNVATTFRLRADMPNDVELIITSEGDNGILFEGTQGRFFVNRGRITGKPVEDLESNPLDEGAIEAVYGGPVSQNHTANFIEAMRSRQAPISDVWSHNRMLEICHLANIAMRFGRPLQWDGAKREIVGDDQANALLAREVRPAYAIEM